MERKPFSISIAKPGQGQVNEDAAIAKDDLIAVSDGAGGGGLYADLWSAYLLDKLPDEPITTFELLDSWLDGIWETFYNRCEEQAKKEGGLVLNKFYDEGSFATLAAVWKNDKFCRWISYGDSVAFHYNMRTGILEHSFTKLIDFNNPPYLINCKDPLSNKGFHCGEFKIDNDSVVFCATDALAHFMIMCYEISKCNLYAEEIVEAINAGTKFSTCINSATAKPMNFENSIIREFSISFPYSTKFENYINNLLENRFIVLDDYSFSMF